MVLSVQICNLFQFVLLAFVTAKGCTKPDKDQSVLLLRWGTDGLRHGGAKWRKTRRMIYCATCHTTTPGAIYGLLCPVHVFGWKAVCVAVGACVLWSAGRDLAITLLSWHDALLSTTDRQWRGRVRSKRRGSYNHSHRRRAADCWITKH